MHAPTSISDGCGCLRSPVGPGEGVVPSGFELRPGLLESGAIVLGLAKLADLAYGPMGRPHSAVLPPESPPPRRDAALAR